MHCTFMFKVEGFVHTQRVSSQAKHSQVLRSSLRVAALGVSRQYASKVKRHLQRSRGGHKDYVFSFPIFSSSRPVVSLPTWLDYLSPFGYMPGQIEWPWSK